MKTLLINSIALIAASLSSVLTVAPRQCDMNDPGCNPGANALLTVEPGSDRATGLFSVIDDTLESVVDPVVNQAPSRLVSVYVRVPCLCNPKSDPTCN